MQVDNQVPTVSPRDRKVTTMFKSRKSKVVQPVEDPNEELKELFGEPLDMRTEEDKVEYKGLWIWVNRDLCRVLVTFPCPTCGKQSSSWHFPYSARWEDIPKVSDGPCDRCTHIEDLLSTAEADLAEEEAQRQLIMDYFDQNVGTPPVFADNGYLEHEQIIELGPRNHQRFWIPGWIAQDGSTESLTALHLLANTLDFLLVPHEKFLCLPLQKCVRSTYEYERLQQQLQYARDHRELMQQRQSGILAST